MSWSYSGDPSKNPRDETRFIVGDTDKDDQLLSNEEIDFLLSSFGNSPLSAAVEGTKRLIAKFAKLMDESVGRVKVNFSQRYDHFKELNEELRDELATKGIIPFAGGLTISGKEGVRDNSDRVEPLFNRDKHDFFLTEDRREGRSDG